MQNATRLLMDEADRWRCVEEDVCHTEHFNRHVYALVSRVPPGRVTTYGDIALALGWPRHARLVGYALANCPADVPIPAHRVVNHRGGVSRAWNGGHPEEQATLLRAEGVTFTPDGRVDLRRHICDLLAIGEKGSAVLQVKDYVDKLDDSKAMRSLTKELGHEAEEDRFQFIQGLLGYPSTMGVGLQLANRLLRKNGFREPIFERCLDETNWRWIPLCLECLLPRLGSRRVIDILKRRLEHDPESSKTIRLARYYLGSLGDDTEVVQALKALDAALENT